MRANRPLRPSDGNVSFNADDELGPEVPVVDPTQDPANPAASGPSWISDGADSAGRPLWSATSKTKPEWKTRWILHRSS